MPPLVTSTDLVQWADRRDAQASLPMLVRQLVLTLRPEYIDFAAGDSVNRPGYDGRLRVAADAADSHVPSGDSVWEMGVGQDARQKADDDYDSRTTNPLGVEPGRTTFVFVTPRRWIGKHAWADARRAEGVWAGVRVHDADDLEQWIERHPAVGAWAGREFFRHPPGLTDLDGVWEEYARRTSPHLSDGLVTAGRAEQADRVRRWLADPASPLRVRADTAEEAIAFVAAVCRTGGGADATRSRWVRADSAEAWRAVTALREPLTVVSAAPAFGTETEAIRRGHRVAVAYGNDSAGVPADVVLHPLRRGELEAALVAMGLDRQRAGGVASESRGRLVAVVHLLGGEPLPPRWAAPQEAPAVMGLLLSGAWSDGAADREAVCRICHVTPEELDALVSRWANEPDAPIRRVGRGWEWVSRRRGWAHLRNALTGEMADRFRRVAEAVLADDDPRLDLPPGERWMAAARDVAPRYSATFRRGVADGLALLGAAAGRGRSGADPAGVAEGVVRHLLAEPRDARRWCSLADVLPQLAEAGPDAFLTAVEAGPVADAGVREALFQEEGFFGGSRHCDLLWALELLAWSPSHLSRAAVALAGLTAADPGGRTGSRPSHSLRMIFLPCRPQSAVPAARRLAALEAVYRAQPIVAFALALRLLPEAGECIFASHKPLFRDWADLSDAGPTWGDWRDAVLGIFGHLMRWSAGDSRRLGDVLRSFHAVPSELVADVLPPLEQLPLERLPPDDADDLRRAVRKVLHEHRTREGMHPGLTPDLADRLLAVYGRLEPSDSVLAHAWLFDTNPDLLSITGRDWDAEGQARDRERAEAVRVVAAEEPAARLTRLAEVAEDPWAVGRHTGASGLDDGTLSELLFDNLDAPSERRRLFARGVVAGRVAAGEGWLRDHVTAGVAAVWGAARLASAGHALPFDSRAWDWVEGHGAEAADRYWAAADYWSTASADAPRAVRTLLDRGRPFAALRIAGGCVGRRSDGPLGDELLLRTLRCVTGAAASGEASEDDVRNAPHYVIEQVLDHLEEHSAADEAELAGIEWVWLPVLERTRRGPAALHRALAGSPALFAQAVASMYRPRLRDGEPEGDVPTPGEAARAERAFHLLAEWHGVPGASQADGLDAGRLLGWVGEARRHLAELGLGAVGDARVGEVLSRAPRGSDGAWPHECVRDLLEVAMSEDLDDGVFLGVVNGGGATSRASDAGGEMERETARAYDAAAEGMGAHPRAAAILRRLAGHYRRQGEWHDDRRDSREFR